MDKVRCIGEYFSALGMRFVANIDFVLNEVSYSIAELH